MVVDANRTLWLQDQQQSHDCDAASRTLVLFGGPDVQSITRQSQVKVQRVGVLQRNLCSML